MQPWENTPAVTTLGAQLEAYGLMPGAMGVPLIVGAYTASALSDPYRLHIDRDQFTAEDVPVADRAQVSGHQRPRSQAGQWERAGAVRRSGSTCAPQRAM
jgi:hypothetical protein